MPRNDTINKINTLLVYLKSCFYCDIKLGKKMWINYDWQFFINPLNIDFSYTDGLETSLYTILKMIIIHIKSE